MGLTEKRAIKEFQDNQYPMLQRKIHDAAGFPVALDVKWDTLAKERYGHLYGAALPKVFFNPLIEALSAITSDDMGKDALKAALKKIVIGNTRENTSGHGFSFKEGILDIDHEPVTNIDDVLARKKAILSLLEKGM